METYDLLQVAGREWRTLCHSADFAAKEKSLLGGTGSCGGIITAPYGGSQRSRKTLKLCLEWPTVQVTKNGRVANGVALPKDPWVSVHKLGADGGACSELIRNPGLPFCVFTIWARDYLKHDQMRTLLPQGIAVPDQLARGPALRTKPVFVVNALG